MFDVLITGGGIVGLLSALELTARGRQVAVIDAGKSRPASWAGGGILSPLYAWRYPQAMNRLTVDAVPRYRCLVDMLANSGIIDASVLYESGLWVQVNGAERKEALQWAYKAGLTAEASAAKTIMSNSNLGEGLWFPSLANIRNPRFLRALRSYLVSRGVRFLAGRVQSIFCMEGRAQCGLHGGGEIAARQVLVAAGHDSAELLAGMGLKLPLFPAKGEMLMYQLAPEQVPAVMLTERGYLIPRADGAVLVGSTLRQGDASTYPTVSGRYQLENLAAWLWSELGCRKPDHHWAGVRPGCGRSYPYMGSVPGMPGVFASVGHYRNGLVAAPTCAELMAQLMCGESTDIDPRPYQLSMPSS